MLILMMGCGSIGKRHIRNLKALKVGEIIAYDIKPEQCHKVKVQYGIEAYSNLGKTLARKPDIALICTPANSHIPLALSAIQSNCHLFIEKPLSDSLEDVDGLSKIVGQKKLVALVACNMRFHPGIVLMKKLLEKKIAGKIICARIQAGQYLSDWHPWEDYRKGYSANKALGGGVILDGIHEIDYIAWFLGEINQIFCFSSKLSSLEIDAEDTAEILLQFKSGAIAEVHLDYIQRSYSRSCQIIGEKGTILWDFSLGEVKFYSADNGGWQILSKKSDYDINEMYIEEMRHFLRCVKGKAKSMQDINDAKRILEIALAAKKSAKTGSVINL